MLVFDIETNGIELDSITTIHCIAIFDTQTKDSKLYHGDTLKQAVRLLHQSNIAGHNIIGYDIPVLKKFYPQFQPKRVVDTMIMARVLEPDREGGHSLEAYGPLFGREKVQNEQWDVFTELMATRCLSDIKITAALYEYLCDLVLADAGWSTALRLEHRVAEISKQQELNGWLFDMQKAEGLRTFLINEIERLDELLQPYKMSKTVAGGATVSKPFKMDGTASERTIKYLQDLTDHCMGPFSPVELKEISFSSEKDMKEVLLELGWVPTEYNFKKDERGKPVRDKDGELILTSPKLTEDSFDSLPEGLGQNLARRWKCRHRLSLLEGLISCVRKDGRIASKVITCGTPTARMRHKDVVNIPKAEGNVFLGKELRTLFTVPDNKDQVGVDAKALEFRCLAHYINDFLFTQELLASDIHTVMQKIGGLPTRTAAKPLTYAIIYGAGDKKLGKIVGGGAKEGQLLRATMYEKCEGLKVLIEDTKSTAKKKGWVRGIDGRKLFIRSPHSSLNMLLQGCGAIVMKQALVIAIDDIQSEGIRAKLLGNFHDEFQFECDKKDTEKLAIILRGAIVKSGEHFNMNCPLDADVKIGRNWADCH